MAGGLARQLGFCSMDEAITVDTNPLSSPAPSWCSNSTFVQFLRDAQTRLWTSINGAREREDFINIQALSYIVLAWHFQKSTRRYGRTRSTTRRTHLAWRIWLVYHRVVQNLMLSSFGRRVLGVT